MAGIVPSDAARVRTALRVVRLRSSPSVDAAAVRSRHRPASSGRRGTGSRAGAGAPTRSCCGATPRRYLRTVRAVLAGPLRRGRPPGSARVATIRRSPGCTRPGAMVAGGSLRAMEAILRGDVEHAFHPGGGLHHAMPDRASGFCIYDDPALAIARARRDGLRVLYVDLDVHHGDGVQAIHWDDPGVVTLSFHESGRYLFPGTGGVGELGEGSAAGTAINVPLEPGTGEGPWLEAVRTLLPEVAAAFGPDIVVSQHGADSHAWDPLAHLRVTTTAMGEAARIVDAVAHRWASGRWLSTGGGGYDAYRVVPRSWSLVWLAGAHRDVPAATPAAWRDTWADEAARYGQAPLPEAFTDQPNAGEPVDWGQEEAESRSAQHRGARAAARRSPADPRRPRPRVVGSARCDGGHTAAYEVRRAPCCRRSRPKDHRGGRLCDMGRLDAGPGRYRALRSDRCARAGRRRTPRRTRRDRGRRRSDGRRRRCFADRRNGDAASCSQSVSPRGGGGAVLRRRCSPRTWLRPRRGSRPRSPSPNATHSIPSIERSARRSRVPPPTTPASRSSHRLARSTRLIRAQ